MLDCLSLFSGAGGLDLGLRQAGFRMTACLEHDGPCLGTLRALGMHEMVLDWDLSAQTGPQDFIRSVPIRPGEVYLVAGGPPCQAFSTAGKRASTGDPRGTLLFRFIQWVWHMRPSWFIFENVRGLVSASLRHRPIKDRPDNGGSPLEPDERPGSVLDAVLHELPSEYRIDAYLLNSADYGVPQLRERVFFIGNCLGMAVDRPATTHGTPEVPHRTLRDAIWHLRDDPGDYLDYSVRQKGVLADVPPGGNWRSLTPERQEATMGGAFAAGGGKTGWWRRLSWDRPAPTILTQPNHSSTSLCHPDQTRPLSLSECAAIQQFPAGYPFHGTLHQRYTQVGNAVPVGMAEAVGRAVFAARPAEAGRPRLYKDMSRRAS